MTSLLKSVASDALLWVALMLVGAALAGDLWYGPRLDAAEAGRVQAKALLDAQSEAVKQMEAEAEARRQTALAAAEGHRRRAQQLEAANGKLREELASRVYREEPCEDAAAALRQSWRSR